jgi:maleate isomerase
VIRKIQSLSSEMDESKLAAEFLAPAAEGWQEFRPDVYTQAAIKVGLISLTNDPSAEIDMHKFMAPFDDVRVSGHRVYSPQYSNLESLAAVADNIAEAAAAIMPDDQMDILAFGCTSAAMTLGSEAVAGKILKKRPTVKVTDPIQSTLNALRALRVKKLAVLTPYIGEVNVNIANYFEERGFDLTAKGFFRIFDDNQRNRVSDASFLEAARAMTDKASCDALFISCTALSTAPNVKLIEDEIGVPVVTSNQALAWNVLRLGGHTGTTDQFGQLFTI